MSWIKSFPASEVRVTITIDNPTITSTSGVTSKAWTNVLSVKGFFWEGATAERYVSSQLRPDLKGVAAIDYTSTIIDSSSRLTVTTKKGSTVYTGVYPQNSGSQDEMILIAVTK